MNDRTRGFLLAALGAATYGMNPLFTLPLYQSGLSPDSVLFYRYALGLMLLGGVMRARRQPFRVPRRTVPPLAVAGLLFAASSLFLFLSYRRMDAGVASTILFVYPVMVAVIMAAVFREKVAPATGAGIALALAGVWLLHRDGDGASLDGAGIGMVLVSALAYAVYMVGVKQSVLRTLPPERLAFHSLLFGLFLYWIRLDFGAALQPLSSWGDWANAFGLALLPTVVSLYCTARAIGLVGATPTAILGALEPLTAVSIGVAIFHEPLTGRLCLGIAAILAAVTAVVGIRSRGGERKGEA